MKYELFGSMVVFATTAAVLALRRPAPQLIFLSAAFALSIAIDPYYGCFVAGTIMAWVYNRRGHISLHWIAWAALLVIAFLLFGYARPGGRSVGFYSFLDFAIDDGFRIAFHSLGAVIVIAAALYWRPAQNLLSAPASRMLGDLSFPLYLVHLPVMCSLTSWLLLWSNETFPTRPLLLWLFAVSLIVTVIVAWPLMIFDRAWRRWVNRVSATIETAVAEKIAFGRRACLTRVAPI
jgi:peptidoglycan/LPS O-acetylase OafA/YrhL